MLKIAFYNIKDIIQKSKNAKKETNRLKKILKEPFEKKNLIETNIERIRQNYNLSFSKMPEEEKSDFFNLINNEIEELKKIDDLIKETFSESENNLVTKIIDIAKEIAKEQKISFLFEEINSFLTYGEKKYNISDLIIEKLDETITGKAKKN